jgi:hypothetical protein
MTLTITEAFELPRPEDIRAMGFVIKLREAKPDSQEVRQLVADYVITPVVAKELPRILDDMKQVYDRGEEYGRFIHGSFGSGKSHFMTMLALLLENAAPAWDKFAPVLAAHRDELASKGREGPEHRSWIPDANLLVVRVHMLSVRGRSTGLDRAIYDGLNQALEARGKPKFEFLHVDGILEEVRREADEYGDVVWKRLETAGIVGDRADFESVAKGSAKDREALARAWLEYKGRDASQAGIDPRWSEGLKRMGEHVKAQGFGGIVLMLDEYLLWLAEKSGQEFVTEINSLNVIVDHNTGQRPAPIFVFVARQRNLKDFFPDLIEEDKIHEHLDHHSKRFEETRLQDVELRHIVHGRVLRPKQPDAVREAIAGLAREHQKLLPALLAGADLDYLRDVYPFHPALIEMLVDVTSLMQRERSALRLLYELLVVHNPTLPLGEFLPVGSAFDAIFPRSGVEASKKVELMQDIHHQYYSRLAPAMKRMADDTPEFAGDRWNALDQLVKTVLLAEVSPRLKQGGLTIERLVQLNSVVVEGETFRGRLNVARTDLLLLQQVVPDLQIAGSDKSASVRYVLGRVNLTEVLVRARSKVDNDTARFNELYRTLKPALGIAGTKGFEGVENDGEWELTWRKTKRKGRLKIANIRELSNEDFEPPDGAFKVLIDYPWDKPGHTVDEDRLRASNVRKAKGTLHTVCWLPRHMTPSELGVMTELAAVRYLMSEVGQDDLLETMGQQDRAKLLAQAGIRTNSLEQQLQELLLEVYINHGEFVALISDVDGSRPHKTLAENLQHIATALMDRRYPKHPTAFLAEPKKADLELLLKWMVDASESTISVGYDEATGKVLRNLGQALELVQLGQTKASLRLDSRFIKDVLQQTDKDSVAWTQVAEHLRDGYGLQPLIIDLFLGFVCQRNHRALQEISGEAVDVKIGMPPSIRIRLQRGTLIEAADWHRLRDLGNDLFGHKRPPAHRSLQTQDRFAEELHAHGQAKRNTIQALYQRLIHLGVTRSERGEELSTANTRLAALQSKTTDSTKTLTQLLAAWPTDGSDPLCAVVRKAEDIRDALAELNEHARKNLEAAKTHATLGPPVQDHLTLLERHLAGTQAELPLTAAWIKKWNADAQALVQRLLEQPAPPRATGGGGTIGQPPEPTLVVAPLLPKSAILCVGRLDPSDPDAVEAFLANVRQALVELGGGHVQVAVVRQESDA